MAWTALGLDESTGMVRWNAGPGQDQYLPQGEDPNAVANPYGWNPNMAMPEGGWTVGQLLSPNYFAQGTTLDTPAALSQALADVAPGYAQPANIDMNAQVPVSQQRAPAKDNGFETLLGAGAMAGLGYLSGGFGLGELFSGLGGDGITSTMASGANPTQVAGVSETLPTFSGNFNPNVPLGGAPTFSGVFNPNVPLGGAAGAGTAGATAGNLAGTAASGAASSLGGGANSLGGTAADVAANALASGGGAAATAAGGSALSRILDGTATSADWLSLAGTGGSTLLGMLGSNQQTQAYKDLARQYMDFGAPSRARFEASMQPGFDVNNIPGYKGAVDTASESLLRRLSATGGNPYGNPGGLIEANKAIISGTALPAYNEYARLNANTGFGSSMNAAVPFQTAAIGSEGNSLNALGYGLGQLTQPPKQDLASLLKQYQGFGGLSLT